MNSFTDEQQQAINCLDRNVAVAAGAGAGKTRVLVERYLHILESKEALCDEIVAITFTNKAAAEMKQRIRQKIELRLATASAAERRYWQDVKYHLELAPIGTIHSLCGRILRDNPVEAGLDPNFTVCDENEAAMLYKAAAQQVITTAAAANSTWLLTLLPLYGRRGLLTDVLEIYRHMENSTAAQWEAFLASYRRAVAAGSAAEDLLADCRALFAFSVKLNAKSAHYAQIKQLEADWPKLNNIIKAYSATNEGLEVLLDSLGTLAARSADKDIVKNIKADLAELADLAYEREAIGIVAAIKQYFSALNDRIKDMKQRRQQLTFDDLEYRAWQLLLQPRICRSYVGYFKYMMVDEVQDINDRQRQIIYLLCGGAAEQLHQDKLFIVGDAKQSIYRFRGADVTIFARMADDIAASGGKLIEMQVNFRSGDRLLAAVNDIFSELMGTVMDNVRFSALRPYRQALVEDSLEFLAVDKAGLPAGEDARLVEGRLVAARIRQLVASGRKLLDGGKITFGKIAILLHAMTAVPYYEAALQESGIPYYIVGGQGFYRQQEILDLLNFLRVAANHYDDTALAGILRSPLFLLSDEAIYLLAAGGGTIWQGLHDLQNSAAMAADDRQAAERAAGLLDRLLLTSGYCRASVLLRLIVDKTGYEAFLLTQFMGKQKFANVEKLIALAAAYEKDGFCSAGDFVAYVHELTLASVREGEAVIENDDTDTVKIMTVHKAKGLEFPVVILPDLERQFFKERGPLLFDNELGLGIKVRDEKNLWHKTALYARIAEKNDLLDSLEYKRLLYVAMTRAQDLLIMAAAGDTASSKKSFLQWLRQLYDFNAFAELKDVLHCGNSAMHVYKCLDAGHRQLPAAGPCCTVGALEELKAHTVTYKEQQPDGIRVFSPTALNLFRKCQRAFFYQYVYGLPEPQLREDFAAEGDRVPAVLVGLCAHRACELVVGGAEAAAAVAQAANEMDRQWQGRLIMAVSPLVENYLASDFYRKLCVCQAKAEYRLRFWLEEDGETLGFNGIIDRLNFYADGTLGIVDYKTDDIDAASVAGRAADYFWQMVLYKIGAEQLLNKQVRDVTLYFLRPGKFHVAITGDRDLTQTLVEIKASCRYILEHHAEDDYVCDKSFCGYCKYSVFCKET